MRSLFLLAAAVILTRPILGGAAEPSTEPHYKPMPWHLLDVWWDIGKEAEFQSYAIDVNISDDVPDDVNLYIAPIGLGHLNGAAFYGGIQTRCDGNTKQNPALRELGRGLLFSMWGERSLDAIRPADGGYLQSSGHEGDFVSVRRPYAWKKGSYTYRLVRMDQETADGSPFTWVGAFVNNHERDENIFVGALRFKGEKLVLGKSLASFVEVYGKQRPVADIPKLTVTFGNLRVNGTVIPNPSAKAVYPKGVPDYADASWREGQVEIKVGERVQNRKERAVMLAPAP